jgi:hypothetical protein
VIDLMAKKSGSSIETMVITSIQMDTLSFWPRPFEVKRVAKMSKKYGTIWKIGFSFNFRKV